MSFLHSFNRKKHTTVEAFKREWSDAVNRIMRYDAPAAAVYIIGFDQRRVGSFFIPKAVHTDAGRAKTKAAAHKKKQEKLAALAEEERKEYERTLVTELDVTHKDPHRELPTDWSAFLGKRENRWRVYQLMVQTLLDPRFVVMTIHKTLVVMGLPFKQGVPVNFDNKLVYGAVPVEQNITEDHLRQDPDLFSRCMWIRGHQQPHCPPVTLYMHYPEWDCNIWEADLLPVHFYRFMSHENWMVYSNDRDMLLTLLAHSMDRRKPGSDDFVSHMYLWMPNKAKNTKDNWRGDFYVDIDELYRAIDKDNEIGRLVYNRVLSYVFIMLLTGCDHVRGDMFHYVGVDAVLKTFYDYSTTYKHMVQLSNLLIPDCSAIRIPLVDERMAIDFISRVYHTKYAELVATAKRKEYEKQVKKLTRAYERKLTTWHKNCVKVKSKRIKEGYEPGDEDEELANVGFPKELHFPPPPDEPEMPELDETVTRQDVRDRTNGYKDKNRTLPSRDVCRRDVRQATLALLYLINGGRDQTLFEEGGLFDPAAVAEDGKTPYWGYEIDPFVDDDREKHYRMSEFVYHKQDLETYKYPYNYLENMMPKRRLKLARDRSAAERLMEDEPLSPAEFDRKRKVGLDLMDRYHNLAVGTM